jgi:hypothetical protein
MVRAIVDQVAALTQTAQVAQPVVARIVISMPPSMTSTTNANPKRVQAYESLLSVTTAMTYDVRAWKSTDLRRNEKSRTRAGSPNVCGFWGMG